MNNVSWFGILSGSMNRMFIRRSRSIYRIEESTGRSEETPVRHIGYLKFTCASFFKINKVAEYLPLFRVVEGLLPRLVQIESFTICV